MTESRTAEFRAGPWIRPEVVSFAARDGQRCTPASTARATWARRRTAAPCSSCTAPATCRTCTAGGARYFREYMFNHLLASHGYMVLDVDYRGSAGYGATGGPASTGTWAGKRPRRPRGRARGGWWPTSGVDPDAWGCTAARYGGFITLMALFTEPESFGSGAALRSVTDWAHYNHAYTARILNQPQDDSVAYRRSSPIYFAEGLRGDLLMAHGMVDVNVHFQDIVRLSQRLIELGKTDWELAVYPVEDHGFVRADSWTDEYRRILELFERTLRWPLLPP